MVPRDEQCPQRGPALTHTTKEGTWVCQHCNQVTYSGSDPLARLRAQYVNGETYEEPPTSLNADFSKLTQEQWHRAVIERARYERGELTDWPNVIDLTDEEKRVLGRIGDALIGLFRRVT